ncbi:RNA polymerase sigma-I factor [Salisediminibacterium halotolerans]|uniref:RNA polymerase sigma factor SigI n=1 Tax=Salisediminibacterium halotolerans TaxID=517425 RepID=A0A1H9NYI5_9BACI|nr:RNA polymerase sigma-I factor [Salisediminibacterium haloalkalitolerans]SER40649.1 RNA polymerase sigma factor [Salisediminibacterium haloalkalitolerans]
MKEHLFNSSTESIVEFIQNNACEETENQFIKEHLSFIRTSVSQLCKRNVEAGKDDEFSVALIGFSEAIYQYDSQKGGRFLTFARIVMRRRVIDFIRFEQRRKMSLSLDYKRDDMEHLENQIEAYACCSQFKEQEDHLNRHEEFVHFIAKLKRFGIQADDVISECPKHFDARENMLHIAEIIVKDDQLKGELFTKKRLPINKLMAYISMSRKTIERNRKYLIALVLVLQENYVYLKEYVKRQTYLTVEGFNEAKQGSAASLA